jgi:hypothetical protein
MTFTVDNLPPYGLLYFPFSTVVGVSLQPPDDFCATETDNKKRQEVKNKFIDDTLNSIWEQYWPRWQNNAWVGSNRNNALDLTRDDFTLLIDLQKKISQIISISGSSALIMRTHKQAFLAEDRDGHDPFEDKDPYLNFREFKYYAATLSSSWLEAFPKLFFDSLANKVGGMTIELKWQLQRPRPYQTALQLGIKDFSYLHAKTALHPSLVAGHCMQGLFGGMGVNAAWSTYAEYTASVQSALRQYSSDFGDRRVLAGVHYPSDILISWLVCFDLLPFVFTKQEKSGAEEFLQSCIKGSIVWKHVQSNKIGLSPTYQALIKNLESKL